MVVATASLALPARALAQTWRNARTGEQIVVSRGTVTIGGRRYALRDCSTGTLRCVESDGPFNLVVSRRCDDIPPVPVGDHVTRIWSMLHHTPILRDSRSSQILYEYSHEQGVTGIYYSGQDLGLDERTEAGLSRLDSHRFLLRGRARFLACR